MACSLCARMSAGLSVSGLPQPCLAQASRSHYGSSFPQMFGSSFCAKESAARGRINLGSGNARKKTQKLKSVHA